jgi:hypothetical protein
MGGFGGGGGYFSIDDRPETVTPPAVTVLAQSAGSARSSLDELIEAIQSTISPAEWDEVGGPFSIAPLGNSLLISADEPTHRQIDALLSLMRKRWGTLRTVSVQADWLWLTAPQLEAILLPKKESPEPGELGAFGLVDENAWKPVAAGETAGEGQLRRAYHAVLTCYNGQTVHAVAGGQSIAVTGMIPVLGGGKGDDAVGYEPQVAMIQQGAALQFTPIVSTNGHFVLLDIHSRVVRRCPEQADAAAPPRLPATVVGELVAALDRPQLATHRLSTTLRLPVDRRMLVGGMTYESKPSEEVPNLYLFVKVAVQELRDDRTEAGEIDESAPTAPAGAGAVPESTSQPDETKPRPKRGRS